MLQSLELGCLNANMVENHENFFFLYVFLSRQVIESNPSCLEQLIPTDLALVLGAWMYSHNTRPSIYGLYTQKRGCQVWKDCLKDSAQLAQMGV